MANYRDNYYGSVLDPIHGDIKLSEIEKWVISHPLFSRLRRVKQNTFLYYVFPSANHSRFEHSIGVMHVAGIIFDSCKENYATGVKKLEKYNKPKESIFFNLDKHLGEREEMYYQELRLAALLHDIGHGPFSHLFDEFSISSESFLKIVENETILSSYKNGFENLIKKHKNKVEHETISCAYIFMIIHELKTAYIDNPHRFSSSAKIVIDGISSERIVKLIEPEFGGLSDICDKEGNDYTDFFSRIITAFPIDADRMDYLLRDSYFSGVTYGVYDITRIYSSFMAIVKDKNVKLIFKESGLDSMLRFIQSRSHLYNQVYFHKTNRAANTMLTYGTNSQKGERKLLDDKKSLNDLADFYIQNSDEYFLNNTVLNDLSNGHEKGVIEELINRKLFKRVYQKKIILKPSSTSDSNDYFKNELNRIDEIKNQINKKLADLQNTNIFSIADTYTNTAFKDVEKSVSIAIKKDSAYQYSDNWIDVGEEFKLMNISVAMVRIYVRRNFNNPEEFDKLKATVIETVKDEINLLENYQG